jgi:uncharacterized membrane protein (DUF485 family)
MKVLKAIILLMYLISYVYAVHKTSIEPDKVIWGYMCALIFLILSIMGVSAYVKNVGKEKNKE